MQEFFERIEPYVEDDTLQSLQHLTISFADVFKLAQHYKVLQSHQDRKDLRGKYSELQDWTKHLASGFVQYDLLTSLGDLVEDIDREIDQYAGVFDIPGNLKAFFEEFGRPDALSGQFVDGQYILLKRQIASVQDQLGQS